MSVRSVITCFFLGDIKFPRPAQCPCLPQPRDVKALQEFLGIMNFYHRFIPNLASTLGPLYQVINTSKPCQALNWTNEMIQAFSASKQALAETTMLVYPCTDCPIALTCDASDVAIGAVLEQFAHGRWEPLAFFSRQLRKPEINSTVLSTENSWAFTWLHDIFATC